MRNLRAAGRATITVRCREEIRATALDQTQRFAFFAVVLGPLARRTPFGVRFTRMADGVDLNHPVEVARDRRVFELHAICSNASSHDANVGRGERRCEYLRDFSRIVKEREIAAVIVAAMLDLHEDRDNSRTLWHSAALPSPSARAVCQRATAGSSR